MGEDVYKENETNSPFLTIRSQRHKFLLCVCARITDLHLDLKNRMILSFKKKKKKRRKQHTRGESICSGDGGWGG